jgi:hypothetical protein
MPVSAAAGQISNAGLVKKGTRLSAVCGMHGKHKADHSKPAIAVKSE